MKKILIIAGLVFFVFTGLMVWGAVATYKYIQQSKPQVLVQEKLGALQVQVGQLSEVSILQCWNRAQSILSNQQWLTIPLTSTLDSLKEACLPKAEVDWEEQKKPQESATQESNIKE